MCEGQSREGGGVGRRYFARSRTTPIAESETEQPN